MAESFAQGALVSLKNVFRFGENEAPFPVLKRKNLILLSFR
jgi:hypothetical protein